MTKFNPENKNRLTVGEALNPITEITDEADAAQYLESYIHFIENTCNKAGSPGFNPRETALANIGYYAGYFDKETADRIYALFHTTHPVFGSTFPSAEEAIAMGKRFATKSNDEDLI